MFNFYEHSLQRGRYVFSLSALLSRRPMSIPCQQRLAYDLQAGLRPARCPCGQVRSCANMDSPVDRRVHSSAKIEYSGIHMLLRGHQMTVGGLKLSSSR